MSVEITDTATPQQVEECAEDVKSEKENQSEKVEKEGEDVKLEKEAEDEKVEKEAEDKKVEKEDEDEKAEKEAEDEKVENEGENEKSDKESESDSQEERPKIQEPTQPNASYRRHSLTHQPKEVEHKPKAYSSSYAAAPAVSQNSNLRNLRELAKKLKPLPTNNLIVLNDLLDSLFDERKELDSKGDFQGSVTIMKVIDHVKEYIQIAEKKAFQKRQQNEVRKENNKVQSRIAKFDLETKTLEKNLKKNIAQSRERLIKDLRAEGEKLEKEWESEEHMRLYNRPSNQLRLLRHQANQMVSCARFKDAEEILKLANKLQSQEQKQSAYQMQTDYENAMALFNQRVVEELNTFDTNAVNQIQSLRARRATMRTVFQNQEKKVEQHEELAKDCDRCWNANVRTIIYDRIAYNNEHPQEMLCTTRSLGKSLKGKQENIILSLPKLHTKKVMGNQIPTPDYL